MPVVGAEASQRYCRRSWRVPYRSPVIDQRLAENAPRRLVRGLERPHKRTPEGLTRKGAENGSVSLAFCRIDNIFCCRSIISIGSDIMKFGKVRVGRKDIPLSVHIKGKGMTDIKYVEICSDDGKVVGFAFYHYGEKKADAVKRLEKLFG